MKNLLKSLIILPALLLMSIFASPAKAEAFDPGRIIDDAVFTNKSSMSVADIQNFLNSKVPVCDTWHAPGPSAQGATPPWICLKNYTENGKSAAQIIWEQAQNFNLNPQVLIVTLQKENGLITDDWPYPWQYRTAMGFACPDNGTCDPAYYGFTQQVYQAARHFRNFYDLNPAWYIPYSPGVRYVRWNPNSACGGSNVNIQNRATAALYSYTPYQPNTAALNNLYGTGDGCSAYGNRNFWRDFTNWFGSTIVAPYRWEIVSQGWDRDITNLPQGERAILTLQARNTGTQTWYNSGANPVRLATSNPLNRGSGFSTSSWISGNRAAVMQQASVAPGQVASFSFEIQANPSPGTYNEYFNLVAENLTWLNDIGQYYPIRVISPNISAQLVENNYPATMNAGSAGTVTLRIKNTGNVTWYKAGSYTADIYTDPLNRVSPFKASTWPSSNISTKMLENSVAPGATGTFTFAIQAPATNSTYQESFKLGITNLGWSNLVINQTINVINGAEITKIPVYRHYNPNRGAHFFTTDLNESNRIRTQGWNYEGIAWDVSSSTTSKPVYRHYNPSRGRHFFTTSLTESNAIRNQGWNYEGIAWYASSTTTPIPIYRHYSPSRGAHFYTKDLNESNTIRSQGWNYEGIEYYAIN